MSKKTINRRKFLEYLGKSAAASAFASPLLSASVAAAGDTPPNVLFVLTDQQTIWTMGGAYQEALKDEIGTSYENIGLDSMPYLNEFMKNSVVFTNHYCNDQVCTPSRGTLFTGTSSVRHGAYDNDVLLNSKAKTFMRMFKAADYKTAYLGKWHLDGDPKPGFFDMTKRAERQKAKKLGVDYYQYMWNRGHYKYLDKDDIGEKDSAYMDELKDGYGKDDYTTHVLFDEAERWIGEQTNPWCCVLSIPDPHSPFTIDEEYRLHHEADMPDVGTYEQQPNPANRRGINQFSKSKAAYLDMSREIDTKFGALVDSLKTSGDYENTIIVFTSDHGMQWGEHGVSYKQTFFDRSARVPMVIHSPNNKARVISEITSHIDVAETLVNLAGVHKRRAVKKMLKNTEGDSFKKLLVKGKDPGWKNIALFQSVHYRSIVTPSDKFNVYFDYATEGKIVKTWYIARENNDILENNNLGTTPDQKLNDLATKLLSKMDATGDIASNKGLGKSSALIRSYVNNAIENGWQASI